MNSAPIRHRSGRGNPETATEQPETASAPERDPSRPPAVRRAPRWRARGRACDADYRPRIAGSLRRDSSARGTADPRAEIEKRPRLSEKARRIRSGSQDKRLSFFGNHRKAGSLPIDQHERELPLLCTGREPVERHTVQYPRGSLSVVYEHHQAADPPCLRHRGRTVRTGSDPKSVYHVMRRKPSGNSVQWSFPVPSAVPSEATAFRETA